MMQKENLSTDTQTDKNSPGLNVLSFFIPLLGAVLYFSFKDESPNRAKAIGRSALWGLTYGLVYLLFKAMTAR